MQYSVADSSETPSGPSSVLIEFTVENYRSLRDEQRLSLVATLASEHEETHVVEVPDGERVLRAAAVFGPNGSGKSNLLRALGTMRQLVTASARGMRGDAIPQADPFALDGAWSERTTTFEVVFVALGVRYQYGYTVSRERVEGEWLYAFPKGRAQTWFVRESDGETESFHFGENLPGQKALYRDATRPNALFLSTAVQLNSEALAPVFDWFHRTLTFVDPLGPSFFLRFRGHSATLRHCETDEGRARVVALMRAADVGIVDLTVETDEDGDVPVERSTDPIGMALWRRERERTATIRFAHEGTGAGGRQIELSDESRGTQRLFAMAGPLIDALAQGRVFVADELGSSLHPLILRAVVELFVDPATNPAGAQLVFATHDTNLLDQGVLRRDQFWLTEKDEDGATTLFPITDFKPRKGVERLEKNYLQGRYGALPVPRFKRAVGGAD